MSRNLEIVKLEIEGSILECNRNQLIQNSAYFEAMFGGSFVESNLKTVKLEGVDLEAMKLIIQQLNYSSNNFFLNYEQILMVLQTAQMLQFEKLLKLCIQYITSVLSARNCIKVWFLTEQLAIHPLYLKAKSIALTEFITIKGNGSLMDLNINQISTYLGNKALMIDGELDVFKTIMQWWCHNSASMPIKKIESSSDNETFEEQMTYLFSCIDFQSVSFDDFKSMSTVVPLTSNKFASDVIHCIFALRSGNCREQLKENNKAVFRYAVCLLDCKPRNQPLLPCITAKMIVQDLQASPSEERIQISENAIDILFYDDITKDMQVLLHIATPEAHVFEKLNGYKIYGYKNQIYIIGGEYVTGGWNESIWCFNFIDEKWKRIQTKGMERRHFKLCRVKDELFIIGGTGPLRVLLHSMVVFSLKNYTWSCSVNLPSSIMCHLDMECCEHNGNLLLLPKNLNSKKYAYLYNHSIKWNVLLITDPMRREFDFPQQYVVYSYKNKIYIKGDDLLLQMRIQDCDLIIDEVTPTPWIITGRGIDNQYKETVLCGKFLYTLAKRCGNTATEREFYTVKQFNVETHGEKLCLNIPINEHVYNWNIGSGCFAFLYYKRLQKNEVINENYLDSIKRNKK